MCGICKRREQNRRDEKKIKENRRQEKKIE
jgi:hypothetical protein